MSNLTNNTVSLQSILDTVNTLPDAAGGIELPTLTNEGVADDLVTGKELINSNGDIVTGTNPYAKVETDADVATQADLIAQIQSVLDGKAGSSGGSVETCTISLIGIGATQNVSLRCTRYVDGVIQYESYDRISVNDYTIDSVVVGTIIEFVFYNTSIVLDAVSGNLSLILTKTSNDASGSREYENSMYFIANNGSLTIASSGGGGLDM